MQGQEPIPRTSYRFTFSEPFEKSLAQFAKEHQHDDRHAFRSAWITWSNENAILFEMETRRLTELQYAGDIEDKMFKSARYYYRKKTMRETEGDQDNPKKRTKNPRVDKAILVEIDAHIKDHSQEKPARAFEHFCETNNHPSDDDILKKKYKNRYYMRNRTEDGRV
jgi:hypothetical protein